MSAARQRGLLILTALICALWGARSCFRLMGPHSPRILKCDIDCQWLMTGIETTPDFAGTLRWWTGPWCCDFVPYYRPMTSLFWWLEYNAFGPMGLQGFTTVHLLSHLILVVICALFLAELLGWRRAIVAISLWCLHISGWFGLGDTSRTFPIWKDSCDIWCGICYVSALWLFLRYIRDGQSQHLALSLLAFVLGITFKEMIYTLPLIVLLMLWYEKQLRAQWRLALPYFGVALLAVLYRFWALNGPGFRTGTNGAWEHRILVDLLGPPIRSVISGGSLPVAVALFLLALLLAWEPARRRLAIGLAGASLVLLILASRQMGFPVTDALLMLLIPQVWLDVLYIGLILLLTLRFLLGRRRAQWLGYGWVVITYIPLTTMQVGDHGFYLVAIGWSIWLTEALDDSLTLLHRGLNALKLSPFAAQMDLPDLAVVTSSETRTHV